ncbi:hypothetical protein [Spiroplasma turonicum]|uniref:Uncharacterized protein n=1 Tax=Spiroplasma turonicum TaxID=216946 RepID=A0A0K1P7V8_9MOLU|nr:hypothetical protein [Spiroplasma turonicum]AKU80284.1 hypothetical protein STURON_001038 [Spiroplasma turonicum]ALX71285.1 hypothetical protein STURO_v1c10340 [Spiroplasma turonicum]
MQKLTNNLNYEKIMIARVDKVYQNMKNNIRDHFAIPKNVLEFLEDNIDLKSMSNLENLGETIHKSFKDWQPLNNNKDELIIINHLLSIIKNAIVVMLSLDTNLKSSELETKSISTKEGIDTLITTSVQAIGVKFSELNFKYNELGLDQDNQEVFKNFNIWIIKVTELDSMLAVSMLLENMMTFIDNYNQLQNKLAKTKEDELSVKRFDLFMQYLETYYLIVLLLELVLTYPLNEGLMNKQAFDKMLPNINLYN